MSSAPGSSTAADNGFIACENPEPLQDRMLEQTPEEVIQTARKMGCRQIVFNVNEPAVSMISLQELGRIAREQKMPLGCLTNGYTTETGTDLLADIFQFINISLKGMTSGFYREYAGIRDITPILRNIRHLAERVPLEITTPIIQGVNDGDIESMAAFLAEIDPEIPWHVFRLLPGHDMKSSQYPRIEEINNRLDRAREKLHYVYFHNFIGSDWVNTLCPSCKTEVIRRFSLGCGGDRLDKYNCTDSTCPICSHPIRMLGDYIPWNTEGGAQ